MSPLSRRHVLQAFVATAAIGALIACSEPADDASGQAAQALPERLRVAVANEPPYTQLNPDGTITGAEPEVFKAVLSKLGYDDDDIEGVQVTYDAMVAGLNAGRWDAIAAGMFMNPERCGAVHYTSPVIVSTESFAVLPGNPENILTVADLANNADLKVAAIAGGFHEGFLRDGGVPASQILAVRDTISGIEALTSERVDAFVLSTRSLAEFQDSKGGYDVTDPIPDAPSSGSGVAFREEDTELWTAYENALEDFKGTEEFAEILENWGFSVEAARAATVEELCGN